MCTSCNKTIVKNYNYSCPSNSPRRSCDCVAILNTKCIDYYGPELNSLNINANTHISLDEILSNINDAIGNSTLVYQDSNTIHLVGGGTEDDPLVVELLKVFTQDSDSVTFTGSGTSDDPLIAESTSSSSTLQNVTTEGNSTSNAILISGQDKLSDVLTTAGLLFFKNNIYSSHGDGTFEPLNIFTGGFNLTGAGTTSTIQANSVSISSSAQTVIGSALATPTKFIQVGNPSVLNRVKGAVGTEFDDFVTKAQLDIVPTIYAGDGTIPSSTTRTVNITTGSALQFVGTSFGVNQPFLNLDSSGGVAQIGIQDGNNSANLNLSTQGNLDLVSSNGSNLSSHVVSAPSQIRFESVNSNINAQTKITATASGASFDCRDTNTNAFTSLVVSQDSFGISQSLDGITGNSIITLTNTGQLQLNTVPNAALVKTDNLGNIGAVVQQPAIPDITGAAPTAADFNGLLQTLRNLGLIAP